MKIGPFNISLSGARAAVPTLGESDAVKSGRLVLPTGGEYYQLLPKLTPLQVRAWLYAWLQGDFTSGYDLTQVMLDTWPRLRKNTHELREAAASCYYRINPDGLDGEEPTPQAVERADFARKMLKRFSSPQVGSDESNFRGFIYDAADALIMGVSCQELIWDQRDDGFQFVRASAWVNPRRLGYTAAKKIGIRTGNGVMSNSNFGGSNLTNAVADDFPTDRFVLGQYRTCSGSATKYSLLRPLAFYWSSMIWGRDWLLRNAEQFGQPWVDLEYDSSINPSDLATLKAGLTNRGASTTLAHQTGSSIKLIEAKQSSSNNLQIELIDMADKFCDLVILGQTMTSDVGNKGALATAKVHQDVRRERIQQLSDWIGFDPGAQLLRAITQANYGDADDCPVLKPDFSEPQDPLVMAQRDQILATFMPLPQSYVYQRHSVPEPEDGEKTVGGVPPAASDQRSAVSDQPGTAQPPKADTLEAAAVRPTSLQSSVSSLQSALSADLAPFTAKYSTLLSRLSTALAMHDEPRQAEIEHLRPELEAMLADTKTLRAVINGQQSAELLEKMLAQTFFNSLAEAKAGRKSEGGQK